MESNKISFGFSKVIKKPNLLGNKKAEKDKNKVELIKCLEGQEIKLMVEKPEEKPLVIPMIGNQKTSSALASLITRRAVLLGEDEPETEHSKITSNSATAEVKDERLEDLETRAARELLLEATNAGIDATEGNKLVLPVVKPDELPLDGAKEPSFDDYESIPVTQFGKAMLRGMGWVEPPKKKGEPIDDLASKLRPKGMGLGADKALKAKPLLIQPEKSEVLEIKRQAYVRILAGKHKDMYGQIEGFDDHAGRIIVKLAIGGVMEIFNEFLCQPVTKKEYTEYGKCINTAKYDEYKRMENEFGQIIIKKEQEKLSLKAKTDCKTYKEKKPYDYIENNERFNSDSDTRKNHGQYDESERRKIKEETCHRRLETVSYKNTIEEPCSTYRNKNDEESEDRKIKKERHRREENRISSNHRHYDDDDRHYSRSKDPKRERDSHKKSRNRSRSSDNSKSKSQSTSSRRKKYDSKTEYSDSSDFSDSDCSSKRKHKKSKDKKSKKSKKSKSKRRKNISSNSDTSDAERNEKRKHYKTKKSKKDRARSRERR